MRAAAAVDAKIESDVSQDGPAAAGSTDHGAGLYSVAVHFGGVRLRVYYTAEDATSTVWLLHGYDVAADPARQRAARETAETEAARTVLARWERQRRAR
jgi:DNA-binding XRE family transcriptional regulator